jgi:ABC-2 type transport system permease protein
MRAVWTIARNDLALRIRDRSVFIIGLIAPLGLAFIFNLIFGGGVNDVGENITLDVGVVDLDGGDLGRGFLQVVDAVAADGLLDITRFDSEEAARTAVDAGEVGAVFIVPEGLTEQIASGEDATLTVVGNVDASTTTQIATSIAEGFASGQRTVNIAVHTAQAAGVVTPAETPAAVADAVAAAQDPPITIGEIEAATRQLDSATYFVAGLSIFFVFFIAGMSVTSMLQERQEGTLARLIGAPIARWSILVGKSLASVIIGLGALTVLVVASSILMGADWGAPLGVAVLVVTGLLAVTAIMMMVGGLAKTPEQAGNLQSVVAVTLAMLGGTFVPISQEGFLADLSYVTPNAWFMRGLAELAGGGVAAALPAAGALAVMAVVFGGIGLVVMGKVVRL